MDSAIDRDFADMFGAPVLSATTMHDLKRQTVSARAEKVGEIVAADSGRWIIWCHTDYEADAIRAAVVSAIEVRGSQSADEKEDRLEAFSTGKIPILISKPSLSGFGMDWSHCSRMAFVGQSFSYESWYQAVRRCWRFGQRENVMVHLIVAEGENEIGRVIDRKADDHAVTKAAMREAMHRNSGQASARMVAYEPTQLFNLPSWIQAS